MIGNEMTIEKRCYCAASDSVNRTNGVLKDISDSLDSQLK
jgi:hypothetical protein